MNFDPMTGEPLNFDPMTGQPIQQTEDTPASEPTGFDPMTGQPIQANTAAPMGFDPMTGQPIGAAPIQPGQPVPPAKKNWVLPVAIGGGVVIIIAVVAILIISGIFAKPINQIGVATANTFNDAGGELGDIMMDASEACLGESTISARMNIEGDDVTVEYRNGKKEKQLNLILDISGAPSLEATAALTDTQVKAQIPSLSDIVFTYNYTEEPDGYLFEDLSNDDIELLNNAFETIYTADQNPDLPKKELKALEDIVYSLEFEKADKEEFEIDGKDVKCKGYTTTVDEDFIDELCDAYKDFYIAYMGEDYEDIIDDMMDDLAYEYEDMPDVEVTFYLYKKELAAIILDVDGSDMEILFEGGDYRAQNMVIAFDGDEVIEIEGETNGSIEERSLSVMDEEYFSYEYDTKSGDFECYICDGYYEYEIADANITSKNGKISILAEDIDFDGIDMEMELTIEKGVKLDKMSGEEFDFGTASESDLEDLVVDELGDDLYDFVEEYSWLFY